MDVVQYEYGSDDVSWEGQTSFTQSELKRMSKSIESIESIIDNIEDDYLTGHLRLCTVNIYKPHRLGDVTHIISVPRAKTYDGVDSSDVTSKVASSIGNLSDVCLCSSKRQMEEEYRNLH
jgi:hypothetical protein